MGNQITTLSLGEDIAQGLGQNTVWVKVAAAVSIVLLAVWIGCRIAGSNRFRRSDHSPILSGSGWVLITAGFCPTPQLPEQFYC